MYLSAPAIGDISECTRDRVALRSAPRTARWARVAPRDGRPSSQDGPPVRGLRLGKYVARAVEESRRRPISLIREMAGFELEKGAAAWSSGDDHAQPIPLDRNT